MVLLVVIVFAMFLAPYSVVNIPTGSGGVLWRRFSGTDFDQYYKSGVVLKWPWNIIYVYDLRLQAHNVDIVAITEDGLNITVSITFRWYLIPNVLPHLHEKIGPDYLEKLILPEINAATRKEFSKIAVRDFYGSTREGLMHRVYETVVNLSNRDYICSPKDHKEIGNNWEHCLVLLTDVLVRDVVLPPRIVGAIQSKIVQEQLVKEMVYRVERERYESERKEIEAEGIRNFQNIVQSGISETYLKWRGIEATVLLATSPNAKTVVVGGSNGLPLILNTEGGPSNSSPASQRPFAPGSGGDQLMGSLDMSRENPHASEGFSVPSMVEGAWSSDLVTSRALAANALPLGATKADDPMPPTPPSGELQVARPPQTIAPPKRTGFPLTSAGGQTSTPPLVDGTPSATSGTSAAGLATPRIGDVLQSPLGVGGAVDLFSFWSRIFSEKGAASTNPPAGGQ